MIEIDDHHLGGAAGGAAGLDRPGGAVADLEEAHQPRGAAAARQPLAVAAQLREIGAGARAVFEEARLAHPQIHDAALVDEVVGDRLDEAGVRLRMLVGASERVSFAGPVIDIVVALRRPVDAVGPVEPGVEPLRRVRRAHLPRQHVAISSESAGILLGVEIAAFPAPIGPGAGEPVEHLAGIGLAAGSLLVLGKRSKRLSIGLPAPQPCRHIFLSTGLSRAGTPALRKYFWARMSQATWLHSAGTSIPSAEDDRAVGVADLAERGAKLDARIGRLAGFREATCDPHGLPFPVFLSSIVVVRSIRRACHPVRLPLRNTSATRGFFLARCRGHLRLAHNI